MIKNTLEKYLEAEPRARERANKNRAIGNVIIRKYALEMDKDVMADIVGEILTADRAWRQILEQQPDLRGSDYNDKDLLEKEAQLNLGYKVK